MRKLPTEPHKRRRQIFKRLYQNLEHFNSLRESGLMDITAIVTDPETSEDICLDDLMVGIEGLPPKQRQAFELICLKSYTETAATEIMLPNSRWSTPVQQYADEGLDKMIHAYDLYQQGLWNPKQKKKKNAKGE
jgi:hypothetical protein